MGNRVSISFINGDEESVALFSHWDGVTLAEEAKNYVKLLKSELTPDKVVLPLDRLEPNTVMVDFIKTFMNKELGDKRVASNYYLGKDGNDGDNSDNGHFKIDLKA
jgi:hypothetical protein